MKYLFIGSMLIVGAISQSCHVLPCEVSPENQSTTDHDAIRRENIHEFIARTQIEGLECISYKEEYIDERKSVSMHFKLVDRGNYIYKPLTVSVVFGEASVSVPFTGEGRTKEAVLEFTCRKDVEVNDLMRPFVTISGNVSENLGNMTWGQTIYQTQFRQS